MNLVKGVVTEVSGTNSSVFSYRAVVGDNCVEIDELTQPLVQSIFPPFKSP